MSVVSLCNQLFERNGFTPIGTRTSPIKCIKYDVDRAVKSLSNIPVHYCGTIITLWYVNDYEQICKYVSQTYQNILCNRYFQDVQLSFNPEYIGTLSDVLNIIPHELIYIISRY